MAFSCPWFCCKPDFQIDEVMSGQNSRAQDDEVPPGAFGNTGRARPPTIAVSASEEYAQQEKEGRGKAGDDNRSDFDFSNTSTTCSVCFELPDGTQKSVNFTRKPLGLDFEQKAPVTVMKVKPGMHGAELMIEENWVVKNVDGTDMPGLDFNQDFHFFSEAVAKLSSE